MLRSSRTWLAATLLVLGCALVVSGCAVDVVKPGSTASLPTSVPPKTSDDSTDEWRFARRSYWASQVSVTTACPTGEVVVDGEDKVVLISTDCARVVLRSSYTTVLAQKVGALVVEELADDSYVLVRGADTIDVAGDYDSVYWDDGSPAVIVTGDSTANPNPVKE